MKLLLSLLFFIIVSTASRHSIPKSNAGLMQLGRHGERAGKRVETWRREMVQFKGLPEKEKLVKVNRFFNQLNFVNDDRLWGKKDYWATPLEFLGSNGGDCEDFTIAKYFSLLELGVPDKKLRLVYVKAITLNQFHMVLAYYSKPSAEPILLDNIDPQIKRASKRRDLLPVYSFNGKNLANEIEERATIGKSSRLSYGMISGPERNHSN